MQGIACIERGTSDTETGPQAGLPIVEIFGDHMKDMTPEEMLRMLEGLDMIMSLPDDLPEVEPAGLVRKMEQQSTKLALTKAAKGGRRKQHWKVRQKKQRERMRPYMAKKYREELMPRRKKLAEDGMWWDYYVMEWKKRCLKIEVTEEEWNTEVAPHILPEHVPIVFRFNTGKPIRLDNLMIKDTDTKTVLFDGQEWMLKKLGAVE